MDPDINISKCSVVYRYYTVAYFWIRENAEDYIRRQHYNLIEPRIYTVYKGYANNYEYEPFFDFLMSVGTQLNSQKGTEA